LKLLAAAQHAAETLLPELREAAREADADPHLLKPFQLRAFAEDVAQGRVTLVDLRPGEEYLAGHLPGARSYPFPELESTDLKALKRRRHVVAYCRGPWCLMARQGVGALNARGVPAKRLRAGIVEWCAEGLELESSTSPETP